MSVSDLWHGDLIEILIVIGVSYEKWMMVPSAHRHSTSGYEASTLTDSTKEVFPWRNLLRKLYIYIYYYTAVELNTN